MNFRQFVESQTMIRRLAIFDFDGTIARVPEKPRISKEAEVAINKVRTLKNRVKALQRKSTATGREKQAAAKELREAEKLVRDLLDGWDGSDWWGHKASLTAPHYNMGINDQVVDAFRQAKIDPQTRAVLLTGRRSPIADEVRNVLRHHELHGKRQIHPDNEKALQHHEPHPTDNHEYAHDEFFTGDYNTAKDFPKTKKGRPDGSTWAYKKYVVSKQLMTPNIEIVETWDDRADHADEWVKLGKELLRSFGTLKTFTLHRVFNTLSGHYIVDVPVRI